MSSFRFFVICVLATATAELAKRKSLSRRLLVFGGGVIATFAVTTLKHNIIPRHDSAFRFLTSDSEISNLRSEI
jgi:hypothetical protein